MSLKLRVAGLLAVAALAGLTLVLLQDAGAQQPTGETTKGADGKTKRLAYAVRYGSAKDLANVLGKYFKGDVEAQAVDGPGNLLLISANAAVFDELLETLAKLDRRPKTLAVEVFVIEVPPRKGEGGKLQPGDKDVDEKELTGTVERVAANLAALQKKGSVGAISRFTLTVLENQTGHALNGATKPYITGITTVGGKSRPSINYRNLGTSVTVTARVGESAIAVELNLDEVRMVQPEDGIAIGVDDQGRTVLATEFATAKLNANVSVGSGQAVLVQGVQMSGKAGNSRTLVVVGAKVLP